MKGLSRRQLLAAVPATIAVQLVPRPLRAGERNVVAATFGDRAINEGRVQLETPPLAENGNSVPLDILVDSPMTEADHVRAITVFAPGNPVPRLVSFTLFPGTGRAGVSMRIRLADSQVLTAVAEMNDGSLWSGTSATLVTLAACIEPLL